jgi:hypothetical protein
MRCQSCEAENSDQSKQCVKCGARMQRPSRRREMQIVPNSWTSSRLDDRAFRMAVWGLLPPTGLVLGPLAFILGLVSIRRARAAGEDGYTPAMLAATAVGGTVMLCSWAGASLILLGLLS